MKLQRRAFCSYFGFFEFQTLEQNAEDIGAAATSGKFLDPNENPSSILQSMREVMLIKELCWNMTLILCAKSFIFHVVKSVMMNPLNRRRWCLVYNS